MKNKLSWGDALNYLDIYVDDKAMSPFSFEDILHICNIHTNKFSDYSNAEDFFHNAVNWVMRHDDDNCAFNILLNTCFENCGCFLASEYSNEGKNPHLFMDNVYISGEDDVNTTFEENVEYVNTVAKTNQWIHTDIGSYCKGNAIVISETSDSYLVAHFDHDVKLSWFMRIVKSAFDSREQFETEYFNFAKDQFDNNGYPYQYVQLPDPCGHYSF